MELQRNLCTQRECDDKWDCSWACLLLYLFCSERIIKNRPNTKKNSGVLKNIHCILVIHHKKVFPDFSPLKIIAKAYRSTSLKLQNKQKLIKSTMIHDYFVEVLMRVRVIWFSFKVK